VAMAGTLRQRITIQRKTHTQNALGEPVVVWTKVATVWTERKTLRGREFDSAGTEQAEYMNVYTLRYRDDISEEMQVIDEGQAHNIRQVLDIDGRKRMLELRATRVV
jgi:SPP1 family predicted phage head-tail adaptor